MNEPLELAGRPLLNIFFHRTLACRIAVIACAIVVIPSAAQSSDPGAVVISEIFPNPGDAEPDSEFVEILNRSSERVDLSNWQLAGGVRFVFPPGSLLEKGSYAVIALKPSALETAFDVESFGPWAGRLDVDGEKLRLLDEDAMEVDYVKFDCGFPWPVVGDRYLQQGPQVLFQDDYQASRRTSLELVHPDADNNLGGAWRESHPAIGPTPGKRNGSMAQKEIPASIDSVQHHPKVPASGERVRVVANVTPGNSAIESVVLSYQIVEPGAFLPAWEAQQIDNSGFQRGRGRPYDGTLNPQANPDFESAANWQRIVMHEILPGKFAALVPGQANRTLLRYRVFVTSTGGTESRAPQRGDPSLNFACYFSDGVPDYRAEQSDGGPRVYPSKMLSRLPVYALISRAEDVSACMGYDRRQRLDKGSDASKVYNWEGALVYDGIVYDHIRYRLRGGNGRYLGHGRRSMKFRFNKGHYFAAKDQRGKRYARKWRVLECSKMFSNRMVGNFGLVDSINGQLWRLMGVPAPHTHWFHFRVVDEANEAPDQWNGDFWGSMLAQEHYDKRFLKQHRLEKGNLYKLSDGVWGGESQARYIAPGAVQDYSDYDGIEYDLSDIQSSEWIKERIDIDQWARFSAVKEAVRHYDFWPGANKNMVYYFAPQEQQAFGKLWLLPYDHDDTWGPYWNNGYDCVSSAVHDKDDILMVERNMLREFRDLVWQSDQLNPMIDDLARTIEGFVEADYDRWWHGNWNEGRENYGRLEAKVQDMKKFAWYGGHWRGGGVADGGRARFLDERAADPNIPAKPSVEFSGGSGFPVDALRFESSAYRSPVGSSCAEFEWRLSVITAPAEQIDPLKEKRKYEWESDWRQTVSPPYASTIKVPSNVAKNGDLCRVRVRHRDVAGRWSHWSLPCEFVCSSAATGGADRDLLVVSEINYHPRPPSADEARAGFSAKDFEWIEVLNPSNEETADLTDVRFTKGVDYQFADGEKLAPRQRLLLVSNAKAFALRYGDHLKVCGEWETGDALSDGGELIRIKGGVNNTTIFAVSYETGNPWPQAANGAGFSLELEENEIAQGSEQGRYGPSFWRASEKRDGSPGE